MHQLISRKSIYVYDLLRKACEDWEFVYNKFNIKGTIYKKRILMSHLLLRY